MALQFMWDRRTAAANLSKHGISFEEAASRFGDLLSLTVPDPDHSSAEVRTILLGMSSRGRLLVGSHAERRGEVRLIRARAATRQ